MALPILDGNQSATTLSTILDGGQHIPAHTVVSLGSQAISNITSAVSGSVVSVSNFPASQSTTFGAVTGSVSVLNFPSTQTIAGTVTANVPNLSVATQGNSALPSPIQTAIGVFNTNNNTQVLGVFGQEENEGEGMSAFVSVRNIPTIQGTITVGSLPAISGTVTANLGESSNLVGGGHANLFDLFVNETVQVSQSGAVVVDSINNPISGTVTIGNSVTISAMPSGALTTRFGSVTTANTAQITSAVTNTSRKYLLAQNISAGTVTIGIGFSPTTTQGIQLTAGGGLTFDAFCPTGAVYWLGAVTGAAFTILEG